MAEQTLVYVPEGDLSNPWNYSGTPLFLRAALRRACKERRLRFHSVDCSDFINTEEVWQLCGCAVDGHLSAACLSRCVRLSRRAVESPATANLLRRLAGGRSWAHAAEAVSEYIGGWSAEFERRVQSVSAGRTVVLSLNSLNPPLGWTGNVWLYLDIPLADFYFNGDRNYVFQSWETAPLQEVYLQMEKRAFGAAAAVAFFSNWAANLGAARYPDAAAKFRVWGAGVNMFRPPKRRKEPVVRPLRALFVARDFEKKGGDLLIEAFRTIAPAEAEFTGVGRMAPRRLEQSADIPNVRLTNALPKAALMRLYQKADLFLFPSTIDAYGLVVAEAMMSGLLVLAAPVAALPEIVAGREVSLLPRELSPESIRIAVQELAARDDLDDLAAWNYAYASVRHQWSRVADEFLSEAFGSAG